MELTELASHFDGVRMNGRGFRARCPSHGSRGGTLEVRRGRKAWLLKCYAGCSFDDIVAAIHLPRQAFMLDLTQRLDERPSSMAARKKLLEMIQATRKIPRTFAEIAQIALQATDAEIRRTEAFWFPELAMTLPQAAHMYVVVSDGPLYTMMRDRWPEFGKDWFEAKEEMWRLMWETYRIERCSLVP